jgi:hypothetical protein
MMISNPVNVGLGFRVYLLDCPPFDACHAKDFSGDYCCHSWMCFCFKIGLVILESRRWVLGLVAFL